MQSTGIGICKECLEKMKSEEVKKELFNVQQAPFEL